MASTDTACKNNGNEPRTQGLDLLGSKKFDRGYINACRSAVEEELRARRKIVGKEKSGTDDARVLEGAFFNHLCIDSEYMFVHRLSAIEGKDENPLNEMRVLCNPILLNQGWLQVQKRPIHKVKPLWLNRA